MNTVLFAVQISLLHVSGLPNIPSPTTKSSLPSLSHTTPQRDRLSGLRHCLAGSPTDPAETGSLYYGLLVHLQLLPTPPRDDAVTISFRPECVCLTRTSTSLTRHAHKRTRPDRDPAFEEGMATKSTKSHEKESPFICVFLCFSWLFSLDESDCDSGQRFLGGPRS